MIKRTLSALLLSVSVFLGSAGSVLAAGDGYYVVPLQDTSVNWPAILLMIVFLAVIGFVAFKNPRRTHLD